jgi:CDP-diacylglycerol---glycerol-3-phosphate 3-phosphatidyltransferase
LLSAKVGHSLDSALLAVYRITCGRKKVNPNTVTILAAVLGFLSFAFIASERLCLGGFALLISGFLDLLDGALARTTASVTAFGGFLDSVLDRYTDLLVMCGVLVHFMRIGNDFYTVTTFVASIGIALVPYARARAEAASLWCKTGLLERPERLILIMIGLFFGLLPYVVLILAVFTHVTVIQRILHVKKIAP